MDERKKSHDDPHDLAAHDSGTSDRPRARRSRRPHKKSRNGCQYCKRRRIKCDEIKPVCGNCFRLPISCNYTPLDSQSEAADLVVRKRGRPRKDWTVVSVEPNTTSSERTRAISSTPSSLALPADWHVEKPLHLPWDAEDLELFHHYVTQVAVGFGVGDTSLWKDRIPRLAFRRHGVLHLLLAVSALHLARVDSSRSHQLEERAEMHLAIGLRQATELLPNLNEGNCAELYVATILICTCTFAKKPGHQHLLLVSGGCEIAWWELFRGVRIVVETIGISSVFAGELGPQPSDVQDEEVETHHHVNFKVIGWEGALTCLSAIVSSAPENVRDASQGALDIMTWCFQETYGTTANPKPTVDAKFNTIMVWLYCLSDEFIGSLKGKQPVPLLLLAYFTVLLQTLDGVWFMKGWAVHVLRGVSEILGLSWAEWLHWPTLQIERSLEV